MGKNKCDTMFIVKVMISTHILELDHLYFRGSKLVKSLCTHTHSHTPRFFSTNDATEHRFLGISWGFNVVVYDLAGKVR